MTEPTRTRGDTRAAAVAAGARRRVLVADDTEALRRFLLRALALIGFEARGIGDACEVDAAVGSFAPDAVLLDWNLGGAPSSLLVDRLRGAGVPVIVITGDPGAVDVEGVPVLAKPIHIDHLRAELERALAGA